MSRIEELIKEKCPNGVKKYTIAELCKSLKKSTLKMSELLEDGYPVINSGRNLYGFYSDYNNEGPAFTVAARGEYAAFVNYFADRFWAGGLCYPYTSKDETFALTKFIYYSLKNVEREIRNKIVADGSIPALNKYDLEKIKIAIPPIEVQEEIVRILDKFSDLEAELEAELEARKKQYEFWRSKLINKNGKNKISDYFIRLKGTSITARRMKEIETDNGEIRIFAGGQTKVDTSKNNLPKKDIINVPCVIVQSRGLIDFIYYDKPCSFKNEMWAYTCEKPLMVKYLYYFLKLHVGYFRMIGEQMGSMPQISLSVTENFNISLPSLNEQERVVNILDKFDKLINNISEGIPAEIEARRKQYEYYRNKLLSFEEINDD